MKFRIFLFSTEITFYSLQVEIFKVMNLWVMRDRNLKFGCLISHYLWFSWISILYYMICPVRFWFFYFKKCHFWILIFWISLKEFIVDSLKIRICMYTLNIKSTWPTWITYQNFHYFCILRINQSTRTHTDWIKN